MTQQYPPPPSPGRPQPWPQHRDRQEAPPRSSGAPPVMPRRSGGARPATSLRSGGATPATSPRQPAPRPAPVPKARKRRTWPWVVGAVVLVTVGTGSMLIGSNSIPPTPTSLPPGSNPGVPAKNERQAAGSVVVYEIVGKGSANTITYTTQGFSQEQQATAQLPFRKELKFDEQVGAAAPLSLTGQNSSRGGAITCRITVDGKVVTESTSTGQYTVVTCRGTADGVQ